MQQTVGMLAIKGALSLPTEILPPKEWIHKAYSFIERNKRTHMLVDSCVATATEKLKDAGIPSILLKGQAYARAYPDPILRQCGDIDLYVGDKNYFSAYKVSHQLGWESHEIFRPSTKHYGCALKNVRIELHRIAARLYPKSSDLKFQEWCQENLKDSERSIEIGGEPICVPSPLFNVVFVFTHMYNHFINGGIGLRHICDWTMLLHVHYNELDRQQLKQCLKEFGLMRGWRFFAPIAVELLGLPKQECPFYSTECSSSAAKIFSFIMMEGNFGRARIKNPKRPKGYIAGKAYSLCELTSNLYSKLWIDPYKITGYYCNYVIKGIKWVMIDLLKRRTK